MCFFSTYQEGAILSVLMIGTTLDIANTQNRNENAKLFKDLCQQLDGNFHIVEDLGSAISFVLSLEGFSVKPARSKIILEMTSELKLSCDIWKKGMQEKLPTLKRQANTTYDPSDSTSGKVTIDRVYRTTDEHEKEVDFEERVSGYKFGPEYIPIQPQDEASLKLTGDAVILIIGFLHSSELPRHHYLETVSIVEGNTESSAKAIFALSTALARESQVMIARYVKKKDSDAVFVVLQPQGT